MKTFRLRVVPTGSWATPWHADTLFGSFCWRRYQLHGEEALHTWLLDFRNGSPPFVISDAFPGDLLPAPLGPDYSRTAAVKVKQPVWLRESDFRLVCSGHLSGIVPMVNEVYQSSDRLHASLGRHSDSAETGGALFETAQWHFHRTWEQKYLSIYVRTNDLQPVLECLSALSTTGFGKNASVGLGAFSFNPGDVDALPWLDERKGATGFISLSHFVPAPSDPTIGKWRLNAKYPKFHGNAVEHPFKGRVLTLAPGSVFFTGNDPREYYGTMVPFPCSEFPNALHYGLSLSAPALIQDKHAG